MLFRSYTWATADVPKIEWLPLDLGHVGRGPGVHSPTACFDDLAREGPVDLLDADGEARGHVQHVSRAAGKPPPGHPPPPPGGTGHHPRPSLHRVAVVGARSRDPAP